MRHAANTGKGASSGFERPAERLKGAVNFGAQMQRPDICTTCVSPHEGRFQSFDHTPPISTTCQLFCAISDL